MQIIIAKRLCEFDYSIPEFKSKILDICLIAKYNLKTVLKNDNIICIPGKMAAIERIDIYHIETAVYTPEDSIVIPKLNKYIIGKNTWGKDLGTSDILIVTKPKHFKHTDIKDLLVENATIFYIDGDDFNINYYKKTTQAWTALMSIIKIWPKLKITRNLVWKT